MRQILQGSLGQTKEFGLCPKKSDWKIINRNMIKINILSQLQEKNRLLHQENIVSVQIGI